MHICINPSTFEILPIQDKQNPYIDVIYNINHKTVKAQHKALLKALRSTGAPVAEYRLREHKVPLPDLVFVANGGLALPRLQSPLVLLPSMKFPQRQAELPYLVEMYKEIGIPTIPFPTKDVFEGQAELKWFFGGNLAVCGPGHRSTAKSFKVLDKLFDYVYGLHGLDPPRLVITPLISADYYHLDVAMLEVNETTCIVHKRSMSPASVTALRAAGLIVHVIDTKDSFCLNAVISNGVLITHKLTDPTLKKTLNKLIGCKIIEVETTEFEKSGGSVRCMTLTV
jgi:N-dimethylarginine dimethylaminohydrolase